MSCSADCVTGMCHTLMCHTLMVDWVTVHLGDWRPLQVHLACYSCNANTRSYETVNDISAVGTTCGPSFIILGERKTLTRSRHESLYVTLWHNSDQLCRTGVSISRSPVWLLVYISMTVFLWVLCLPSWGYASLIALCVLVHFTMLNVYVTAYSSSWATLVMRKYNCISFHPTHTVILTNCLILNHLQLNTRNKILYLIQHRGRSKDTEMYPIININIANHQS